jgi:glycosyltransferase involved in cell wall biosynthesis
MSTPLVSIIMCVYNAGEYLLPAVRSVLAQSYQNLELIVIDDGSTDDCLASIADVSDPRVRVLRQANAGKPAAMNVALDQIHGEFYAIQDADDLSSPQRVGRQVEAMQVNPDVAAVYCGHELILGGRRMAPTFRGKDREACRRDIERYLMPAHDPTGMYRVSMVGDLRYEEALPIVEGFDYILRVGEVWPMIVLGECLYSYRIHFESVTRRSPSTRNRLAREVLRRACDRRGTPFHEVAERLAPLDAEARAGDVDNNVAARFMESVCDLRTVGRRGAAIRTALQCSTLRVLDPHYHKSLVYAVAPWWVVRRLREVPS